MSKDPGKPLFVKVPYNPTADLPQQCGTVCVAIWKEPCWKLPFLCAQNTFPLEGSDLWDVKHHLPAFADQVTSERPNTSTEEYKCSTNRKRGHNLGKEVFKSLLLSITFHV